MKKILGLVILLTFFVGSGEAFAMSRSTKYKKASLAKKTSTRLSTSRYKHTRYRRIYWNPVLKGSRESMLRQNEEIDRLELPRIQNDEELEGLILRQELVPLQESESLAVAGNLEITRRFARPWTTEFLSDLGDAFHAEFGKPIQVNSAVRTMDQQKKLRRRNRNAAPIEGETASSHLAGTTVDIAKRGLSKKQKKWLDAYLKNLVDQGLIEAAEERRQACYHIMVTSRYSEWRNADGNTIAQESTATLSN